MTEVMSLVPGRDAMRAFALLRLDAPGLWDKLMRIPSNANAVEAICMGALWADSGMQSVSLSHKYAAALMATDCEGALRFDVAPPWPTFEVIVPAGLIELGDGRQAEAVYFNHMPEAAHVIDAVCAVYRITYVFQGQFFSGAYQSLAELVSDSFVEEYDNQLLRALSLLRRLALNVMLYITSVEPSASGARARSRVCVKRDSVGRPRITTHCIGQPLKIDCRKEIREYVSGSCRGEPKVTTLVRGHWRNQACGPRHSLRRVTWIEPFYRGHGPMLIRPVMLGCGALEAERFFVEEVREQ